MVTFPAWFCIFQSLCTQIQDDSLVLHLFLPSLLVLLPCFHTQKHCCGCQEVHLSRGQRLLFPIDLASRLCKNCFHQNFCFSLIELVPNLSTCIHQRLLSLFQLPSNLHLASQKHSLRSMSFSKSSCTLLVYICILTQSLLICILLHRIENIKDMTAYTIFF